MTDHKVIYSWNTEKTAEGFKALVVEIQPLSEPNERGTYANNTIVKTGMFKTRAQASGWAKKWVRYLKAQQ